MEDNTEDKMEIEMESELEKEMAGMCESIMSRESIF